MGNGVWPFVRDDDGGASANGRVMRDKHINDVYPGPSCWPLSSSPAHTLGVMGESDGAVL